MSLRTAVSLLAVTLALACDVDRTEALELLAEPDLDPEVRAELEALAEDHEADDVEPQGVDALTAEAPDPAAGSCFFCPPPQTDPATYTPVVINPYVQVNQQGNTILLMSSASSYIVLGATVKLQIPYTTTTYGPYTLSYTDSATQFRANVTGAFPPGSCRIVTVTNPNLKTSSPVSLCR